MRSGLSVAVLLSACAPGWELPEREAGAQAVIEPAGSLEAAPSVLRVRVAGAGRRSELGDYRLFEGELGAYHLGKIRSRELPRTLLEREVPVVTWLEGTDVVVAPARVLALGQFSLATPESGLVATFHVAGTDAPVLERLWPPAAAASGTGLTVYSGDGAALVEAGPVLLAPSDVGAAVRGGLDESGAFAGECVRIDLDANAGDVSGALVLPPLRAGGVAFAPSPLWIEGLPAQASSCDAGESALGPACARADDDRAVIRAPGEALLLALASPRSELAVIEAGASLVVRGLSPRKTTRFAGRFFDARGVETHFDVSLVTGPRREHVVINEVLANPAGPEAQSEWVELVNDGASTVELGGFSLMDAGGSVVLPAAALAPGEIVLLVADGFAPDAELDVPPAPGVRILALPALGKGGLSNSGELLRLLDAQGNVISRWPALPAPAAGQSLARRTPDALDGESSSFAAHAAPFASPGAPNTVEP